MRPFIILKKAQASYVYRISSKNSWQIGATLPKIQTRAVLSKDIISLFKIANKHTNFFPILLLVCLKLA